MAHFKVINVHRTWEDYLGIALGVLIVLSPAFTARDEGFLVMTNTGLIGVLVLALGAFELVDLHRWEEVLETLCGLWLVASPFVFGYADGGALMIIHLVLGCFTAILGGFEFWQDRKLTDSDLAKHVH